MQTPDKPFQSIAQMLAFNAAMAKAHLESAKLHCTRMCPAGRPAPGERMAQEAAAIHQMVTAALTALAKYQTKLGHKA